MHIFYPYQSHPFCTIGNLGYVAIGKGPFMHASSMLILQCCLCHVITLPCFVCHVVHFHFALDQSVGLC